MIRPIVILRSVIAGILLTECATAVMYNRDTGNAKSQDLADLTPFDSRANIPGCSAVLIAPNVLLSASHCVNYAGSGTVTATWNGQSRSGAAFTKIGADHMVIVTSTPFTGTLGKMSAPYSGSSENGRLAWKIASGGHGVIGYGSTGPFYDGVFRGMTNRIEVNNVSNPPNAVTSDWLFYDNDGPPSRPSRTTTWFEGGTAPGDSGGPLYMFENGRWYVIGVTSGPDAGYYRDGRVRTDMSQIESLTGHSWARPVTPVLEMRWVAQDLAATLTDGAAVASWPRNGGSDAWTNATADGGTGTASLDLAATPNGTAAVDFSGSARLGLAASSNPVATESAFTVAMVVRADAAGVGAEGNWFDNTGLIDADESGVKNDWGLSLASTGKPGIGIGNADATQYAGSTIHDGQWRVVVATWDGSEVTGDASGSDRNTSIYVDSVTNVTRRQGPEFLNVSRTGVNLTLGGSRNAARYLDGAVAELRLYRGALDDSAVDALIRELRNAHIGPQLGLDLTRPVTGRAAVPLGQGVVIDGSVTGATSVSITQTSGPSAAVLSSSVSLPSHIQFNHAGVYQFSITATQGASSQSKSVLIEVLPTPSTIPSSPGLSVGGTWTAQNLGDASTAGALSTGATTMSLTGAGLGFQEVSDSMRFVWKPLTGDGSITGRITGFSANNGGKAYGGLMLRSSLRRESANVAATVVSGGGLQFTRRNEAGSYTEPFTHSLRAPYWVRVERIGNVFTGYRSEDGVTWTQQGSPVTLTLPASALWGLAVTSHAENSVSQTSFTNVLLEPLGGQAAPSNSWTGADIGSPVPAGSHSGSGSSFNVNGGGADIFGTSDSFRFHSQPFSGDARITARVASQDRTDPWAKAGVMVRASSAANAANAFMAVTPLNGMPWQTRATDGASTGSINSGTTGFTAPYWLRLTRSGNNFTCFRSTDGVNWIQLGPVETIADAPATLHAGVMIASLNNSGNSVINLDNLSVVESGTTPVLPFITCAAGQNPSLSNNFTLASSVAGTAVRTWQKVSGPGDLTFSAQNTASPQTAFTQNGTYVIRTTAEVSGAITFVDRSHDFQLDARWDFNTTGSTEGWSPLNATANAAGGLLTGSVTAGDPQFSKLNAVYVSGSLAPHLLVRYRSTAIGTCQLFWGRVGAGNFSGSRVVNLNSYSPANAFSGLIANPSAHSDWNSRIITDFRFDPTGGAGSTFDIDWMALSDGDYDNDGLADLTEGGADPDNDSLPNFADTDSNNDGLPDSPLPPADVDGDGFADALETLRYWNASPLSKTWQVASTDWNTGPLGTGTQSAWNPGDDVVFDRPDPYTVTLSAAMLPGRATFRAGQVSLAGAGSISAATLAIESAATLTGDGDLLFRAGSTALTLDGTLHAGNPASPGRSAVLQGGGQLASGTLRVAEGSFSGVLTGSSSFIKTGSGTLVLSGNSTTTGAHIIDGGVVQAGTGGTTGSLGSGSISHSGSLIIQRSDAVTWSGSLSGSGTLSKPGSNSLTLTGTLTHSGGTQIGGGMIQIGDGGTTGSLNGGPVSNSGILRFNRSDLSFCDAVISGGSFSKLGAGTLVLSGNNSFGAGTLTLGGGTQNVGYIRLAHPKALGNHSKIYLASGTSGVSGIEVSGGFSFPYAIDTVGRNTNAGNTFLRNVSGFNLWEGNITITSGGGSYDIESLAGELTITGNIGVSVPNINSRALNVKGAGNVSFEGIVSEATGTPVSINKSGSGTLRIDGANTATGAIAVSGGTLLVNGSVTPTIQVAAGSTLGGDGQIGSATLAGSSAAARAALAPGDDSVGSLTSTGSLTFGVSTIYPWQLSSMDPQALAYDSVSAAAISITATAANPLVIAILPTFTPLASAAAVFPIATASGSLTGFTTQSVVLDASLFPAAIGTWQVRQNGNTIELVFSPAGYNGWIAGFPGIADPAEGADPDGDAWSNRDEWIAGTDPTHPGSRFSATITPTLGIGFQRVPGRSYVVDTSVDLNQWTVHATVPDGSGPITLPPPDPAGPNRYYRVRIVLGQ